MKPRYIQFAGEKRPVYFGFNAIWRIEQETDIPFSKIQDLFQDIKLDTLIMLLHVSLEEGARKEGQKFELTKEQVVDGLDEYGVDRIEEIIDVIMSFLVPTEEGGKKPSGEASKPLSQ
jgi:hypothetical protein